MRSAGILQATMTHQLMGGPVCTFADTSDSSSEMKRVAVSSASMGCHARLAARRCIVAVLIS